MFIWEKNISWSAILWMVKNMKTDLICNSGAAGFGHPTQFRASCDHRHFILGNKLGFTGL